MIIVLLVAFGTIAFIVGSRWRIKHARRGRWSPMDPYWYD